MSELRTYRRRQDKYGYFTVGYFYFLKNLELYGSNLKEFEMYNKHFDLESVYSKFSKQYTMLHYFDLKEKTIEIKFLEKETNREVMSDTYTLSTSSYLIVRETINYDKDLRSVTLVNPVAKFGHVTMYSADRVSDKAPLVKIFRNKTDFLTNYDCVYTIIDSRNNDKYYQIEHDISGALIEYNNSSCPTINNESSCIEVDLLDGSAKYCTDVRSNRDAIQNITNIKYEKEIENDSKIISDIEDDFIGE